MPSGNKGWYLDLAHTPDEVLVLLGREGHLRTAADQLLVRYRSRTEKWIRRLARAKGLLADDMEDAQQQAVFWLAEAIRAYDFGQLAKPAGRSFTSFAKQVVQARFSNFVRALRRRARRLEEPRRDRSGLRAGAEPLDPAESPEAATQRHELLARLREAVAQFDPASRALWEGLCEGKPHELLAKEFGVCTKTIQRRWQRLAGELAERLRSFQDGE